MVTGWRMTGGTSVSSHQANKRIGGISSCAGPFAFGSTTKPQSSAFRRWCLGEAGKNEKIRLGSVRGVDKVEIKHQTIHASIDS